MIMGNTKKRKANCGSVSQSVIDMYTPVIFALLAALCWGSSDFMAKISAERIGALRTALFLQYVGIIFLLLIVSPDLYLIEQFPNETLFTG
jgi:drug/metabolite transporter (DMT)-like permease